jgi:hypothetical protein
MEAPRPVPGSKAAPTRRQVVTQKAENDLGHQLFADRDFAPTRKPELHGANIIIRAVSCESSFNPVS